MSWGPGTTASRGKIALQMTRDVCVTFLDSLKNPLFHYQKKFLIRCNPTSSSSNFPYCLNQFVYPENSFGLV